MRVVEPLGLERTPGLERVREGEWWCVETIDLSGRAIPVPSAYLTDRSDVVRRTLVEMAVDHRRREVLGTERSLRAWDGRS